MSIIGFLVMGGVAGWIWHQNVVLKQQRWEMLENQSKLVAEKALRVANYDTYSARLLALDVLPMDLKKPNRPYTPEAEYAMRTSCYQGKTILKDSIIFIQALEFSKDGNQVMAATGNTINIRYANSGKLSHSLQHNRYIKYASLSLDGKRLVSTLLNSVYIWDLESERIIDSIVVNAEAGIFGNDNQNVIAIDYDNGVIWFSTWNLSKKEQIASVEIKVPQTFFSYDSSRWWDYNAAFSLIDDNHILINKREGYIVADIKNGTYSILNRDDVESKSELICKEYGITDKLYKMGNIFSCTEKGDKYVVA